MSETTLAVPNGIIFVFDPSNKDVQVPKYVSGALISANSGCVSVGTQAPEDGETHLSLSHSPIGDDIKLQSLAKIFDGEISTPGRKIALVTCDMKKLIELDVPSAVASIGIWVDDQRNPSAVVVVVQ